MTLTESMRYGVAFITLGADGVLSGEAGRPEVYRLCLNPTMQSGVDRIVERCPTRVNGCGGAFAGAAFGCLVGGLGRAALVAPRFPRDVLAAVAGSLAALRRIGYDGASSPADFVVEVFPDGSGPGLACRGARGLRGRVLRPLRSFLTGLGSLGTIRRQKLGRRRGVVADRELSLAVSSACHGLASGWARRTPEAVW
jgi:hypothetical protein